MNTSTNKTTQFRYNADGKLVELAVQNEGTGTQVTRWVYGTSKEESGVASNELVRAKIYPDSDDQGNPLADGSDMKFDRVEYRYNTLGEVVEMKDQNQTVHQYVYDPAGRLTADKVTVLGAGVDGAVRAIGRSYDARGQLASVTSYGNVDLTTVVNQVTYSYNGFGQVLTDIQSHAGAVTGTTPRVGYEYESGAGNTVRQKKLVYPDGRQVHSLYGTTGTIDDLLDRVRELRDGTITGTVLARYTKRGTNATVVVEYPEPSVELTYIKQGSEPDGDAGDQYTGLDRFNRIEDIRWLKRAGATSTDVDRFQYGFDRASNRTWRKNLVASTGFDEAYQYDRLYQLSDMRRGGLNINHTTVGAIPVWQESWNYDSAGNWKDYTSRVGGADPTVQSRTHNKVNEITFIDGSNTEVGYDGAGNMTVMPKVGAPGTAQQNSWDAWNRLVKVMEGTTTIGQYAYDGLTRRIWKETIESSSLVKRHGYFTSQWQLVEERTGTSETAERQFVWGTRYIDDLILRDCEAFTPTRLYTLHDQWHVTGVVDATGAVQERYIYSAFGVSTVLTGTFGSRSSSSFGWETRYGAYRFDAETALYYVRYRYLHPAMGRWMSRDPIAEIGGLNLIAFVGNNPQNSVDIFGTIPKHGVSTDCRCVCEYIKAIRLEPIAKAGDGHHGVRLHIFIERASNAGAGSGNPDLDYWEKFSFARGDQILTQTLWQWHEQFDATESFWKPKKADREVKTHLDNWRDRACITSGSKIEKMTDPIVLPSKKEKPIAGTHHLWITIRATNPNCAPKGTPRTVEASFYVTAPTGGEPIWSINGKPYAGTSSAAKPK